MTVHAILWVGVIVIALALAGVWVERMRRRLARNRTPADDDLDRDMRVW